MHKRAFDDDQQLDSWLRRNAIQETIESKAHSSDSEIDRAGGLNPFVIESIDNVDECTLAVRRVGRLGFSPAVGFAGLAGAVAKVGQHGAYTRCKAHPRVLVIELAP